MRSGRFLIPLAALLMFGICIAQAAQITLKDGTILQGVVIRQQDGYWIKTADGNTRTISDDDVASVTMDTPDAQASSAEDAAQQIAWARSRALDAA